jgi:hypothetical protein
MRHESREGCAPAFTRAFVGSLEPRQSTYSPRRDHWVRVISACAVMFCGYEKGQPP